jgi:hydroxypyruvate reductase
VLALQNSDAVVEAAKVAARFGFQVEVTEEATEGNYEEVSDRLLRRLIELHRRYPNSDVALISGGEVSCPVVGGGVGGRNQEFVLYSASRLREFSSALDAAVLSCGTDGIDGNSSATGAVACSEAPEATKAQGLEVSSFIHDNDSHSLLKQVGGLVFTGPTGNNVRDLRIMLARAGRPGT